MEENEKTHKEIADKADQLCCLLKVSALATVELEECEMSALFTLAFELSITVSAYLNDNESGLIGNDKPN
ncbi:hypothetical protein D8682_05125 [Buttiauxella sp. 3AFRM03]|uniref:hypothetical protein n=1 Tax=Buttiauxella sp. 3AFRM03 TaxID=2479367 RepID=UPI000EF7CE8F|nr:hypothetical protein [Buttiauxella sp. 3AFRM03]AYN26434.1 hypothetical protein D8682_05125 [Buttiauxella sp. 3AFRM03]